MLRQDEAVEETRGPDREVITPLLSPLQDFGGLS